MPFIAALVTVSAPIVPILLKFSKSKTLPAWKMKSLPFSWIGREPTAPPTLRRNKSLKLLKLPAAIRLILDTNAATGAAIGTVIPVVGTAIGGLIGAGIGGLGAVYEITIRSSAAEYLTYIASVGDQQDNIEMRYEYG